MGTGAGTAAVRRPLGAREFVSPVRQPMADIDDNEERIARLERAREAREDDGAHQPNSGVMPDQPGYGFEAFLERGLATAGSRKGGGSRDKTTGAAYTDGWAKGLTRGQAIEKARGMYAALGDKERKHWEDRGNMRDVRSGRDIAASADYKAARASALGLAPAPPAEPGSQPQPQAAPTTLPPQSAPQTGAQSSITPSINGQPIQPRGPQTPSINGSPLPTAPAPTKFDKATGKMVPNESAHSAQARGLGLESAGPARQPSAPASPVTPGPAAAATNAVTAAYAAQAQAPATPPSPPAAAAQPAVKPAPPMQSGDEYLAEAKSKFKSLGTPLKESAAPPPTAQGFSVLGSEKTGTYTGDIASMASRNVDVAKAGVGAIAQKIAGAGVAAVQAVNAADKGISKAADLVVRAPGMVNNYAPPSPPENKFSAASGESPVDKLTKNRP